MLVSIVFLFFTLHSTPLALWRGVGGEAFTFHSSLFTLTLLIFHPVAATIMDMNGLMRLKKQ